MRITKFVHSCLLVQTPDLTAIFDPGVYSRDSFDFDGLERLDDILITHVHPDHCDPEFIKKLVEKFPNARITGTQQIVDTLAESGIKASTQPPEGVSIFDSPHENKAPLMPVAPEEIGIHYLGKLSHPGDSHSFKETMPILALPVTAPWGTSFKAIALAYELKPKHVLPIHDWHWHEEARALMYERFEKALAEQGIKFYKLQTGQPIEIDL